VGAGAQLTEGNLHHGGTETREISKNIVEVSCSSGGASTRDQENGKQETGNRKRKIKNGSLGEGAMTGFLFAVLRFLFAILLQVVFRATFRYALD
jgi:hypothetical protein